MNSWRLIKLKGKQHILTAENLITENLSGDITDLITVPGKYIMEFETEVIEITKMKWLKWLFPDYTRVRVFAKRLRLMVS